MKNNKRNYFPYKSHLKAFNPPTCYSAAWIKYMRLNY